MSSSFMRSIFEGTIEDELVFPYPKLDPAERENLDMLLDSVRKFASRSICPTGGCLTRLSRG